MNSQLEIRTVPLEGAGKAIEGYAVRWGVKSSPLPMGAGRTFTEMVERGAFTASLAHRRQALLWSHDPTRPLATVRAGTLILTEDAEGLRFHADLPDTSDGRDARVMVEDGILDQMSFGFMVRRDSWRGSERTLHTADLAEISLVHDPAYPATNAAIRSFQASANLDRRTALRLRLWRSLRAKR